MHDPAIALWMTDFPRSRAEPPHGGAAWMGTIGGKLDLMYLAWGRRSYGPTGSPVIRREGYMYVLADEGTLEFKTATDSQLLEPGQMLLIHPDTPCGWLVRGGQTAKSWTWLWRMPPHLPELCPERDEYRVVNIPEPAMVGLRKTHAACRQEVSHPDPCTPVMVEALHRHLDVLAVRAIRQMTPIASGEMRYELACRWLQEHLDDDCPVEAVADYLQVSTSTLRRLFLTNANCTVHDYVRGRRMETARQMLDGGMRIKEVGFQLGYKHANDFNRAYRRYWGVPPGQDQAERARTSRR